MAFKLVKKMNEPFQIEAHSFGISAAPVAYTLQSSVTGDFENDVEDVVSVSQGEQCTGATPRGLFFRCYAAGATDEVTIMW